MTPRNAASRDDPVTAAAGELYGLPPGEFIAARNAQAKQARAGGDADTAAAIRKLAKPSVVAWLANQLVRTHADEVKALLDVGSAMRQATAVLDVGQLRALSSRRQQVVRSLLTQARDLASTNGQALTDATARDLESTLHAALADELAASALSEGRLTAGLSYTGFPGVEAGAVPTPRPARQGEAGQDEARQDEARRDEARARADAQAAARAALTEAEQARVASRAAVNDAEQAARDLADAVRRLRSELDAALAEQAGAGRAERQARKDADRADRGVRQAEQRLAELTARVSDL